MHVDRGYRAHAFTDDLTDRAKDLLWEDHPDSYPPDHQLYQRNQKVQTYLQ